MAYTPINTGNPIGTWGSVDPRDLVDNAAIIDRWVNDQTITQWRDRFGVQRLTWNGMEIAFQQAQDDRQSAFDAEQVEHQEQFDVAQAQRESDFNAFLLASGYQFIGDYDADGPLTISQVNQIFSKDGEFWRADPALGLPYTTINDWVTDEPNFVSVGDAALRQELTTGAGSGMVGHQTGSVSQWLSRYDVTGFDRLGLEIIAHRGWRDIFPESTVLAYSCCKASGADAIEGDVQITSDGVPVMFHDDTVDAQTNGTGAVSSLTLAQFQALTLDQVSGTIYSAARLATFDEYCAIAKRDGLRIYPEIKKYRTQADIELMAQVVINYGLQNMCVWTSQTLSDLPILRTYIPDAIVGIAAFSSAEGLTYIPQLQAMGGRLVLLLNYPVAGGSAAGDIAVRDACIAAGIDIVAFTVPSAQDAVKCIGNGINKMLTNINLRMAQ